jgi:hypothetical protein
MVASRCKAAGVFNARRLHLDHNPPLRDDERTNERTVCDPARVGWLCVSCHTAKTTRERRA